LLGDELELSALRSRGRRLIISSGLTADVGDPEADCNGGIYTDLDEALGSQPDIVLICTPSSMHVPTAIASVRAGAAVFVEKPLSSDLVGVDELVQAVAESGAVVSIGCQLRFHPALIRLHELLDQAVIGTLLRVDVEQAEYLPSFHPYEDYRESYAALRALGGGVVLTQIHELDYVEWLFGQPERVFATGGRLGSLELDVEDSATALLVHRYRDAELGITVHLDYLQRPQRRSCRVVGERGVIEVDLRAPTLRWTDNDGEVVEALDFPGFERPTLFVEEMQAFLESARRERPPTVSVEQARGTMRLGLAILSSMESGEVKRPG
jgi:predicted dehydrogenase